jgi:predicted AlkP superfamily pyrophosphatase or phosphodiesterase
MTLGTEFVTPQYDSLCFANLPQAIVHLLSGAGTNRLPSAMFPHGHRRYKTVILILVDAFGWRFVERYGSDYPFLRRALETGGAHKLTSQFPSTTAAHVTTIHTGQPLSQNGVLEWQYYEPRFDALIAPLLHSYAGTTERDTLPPAPPAELLYPAQTLYHELKEHDVESFVFQHYSLTQSTFSRIMFRGANVRPYRTLPEALTNLAEIALENRRRPTYLFLYFAGIDTTGHTYGPNAPQLAAEVDTLLTSLERLLWRPLNGRASDCLLLVTADHGMVEVDPATTIYLNQQERFAGLERLLKRNRRGELLVPAGSCRDMFLYVQDGRVEQAQDRLGRELAGRAEVWRTEDLIDRGLFGTNPVSDVFRARAGDLVILPYRNEAVWWYERGRFEQNYYGHHGGLTREEVEIPLLLMAP